MVIVDVFHDTDQDQFPLWTAHKTALDLSMKQVAGFSYVGRKVFIGPRKLVYVSVFVRAPLSASTDRTLVQKVLKELAWKANYMGKSETLLS